MNLNKNLGYYAFGLCSIALSIFAVLQSNLIEEQQVRTEKLVKKVKRQDRSIKDLERIVDRYREENEMLVDSILELNGEVRDLNMVIAEQDNIINSLEKKLNKKMRSFEKLEQKIAELEAEKQDNSMEIARIEAEKTQLLAEYEDLEVEKKIAEDRKATLEISEVKNLDLIKDKQKRLVIDDITNNTVINFQTVKVGSKPKRANLKKIKKGSDKWMYTKINFVMTHGKDSKLIANEQFVLKIIDTETNKIVPYLEENPSYPESEAGTMGKKFSFKNNPIEVLHINTQKKNSKNYEARIYFVHEGAEYLLANSHRVLVSNGKVIK